MTNTTHRFESLLHSTECLCGADRDADVHSGAREGVCPECSADLLTGSHEGQDGQYCADCGWTNL